MPRRAPPRFVTLLALGAGLLALGAGLGACRTAPPPPAAPAPPPAVAGDLVVLLSIDGFRWDYLDRYDAPHLRALAAAGVRARRLTPSFPSKTFPNHYTLVTGLRPARHGIVANWFYDPADDAKFDMAKIETRWWAGGEPIWITAEKQGVRAVCYFWPGSETELQGRHASRYLPFNKKLTNAQRVDGLLGWLEVPPAERPRLATLYFNTVDDIGHEFGPDAPETAAAVHDADAAVGRLLAGLDRLGLRARTNLLVVSDHGMSPCGPDRVLFFEDLVDTRQVRIESTGPNGGVRPLPGGPTPAALVAALRAKAPPQLQVYLREEVPARFHYRDNPRIPPVVLMCADHWNLESKVGWPARRATYSRGSHGWDPETENMGALFVAAGPAFAVGRRLGAVDNVDVYPLLCALLGLTPAPNDGSPRLLRAALR